MSPAVTVTEMAFDTVYPADSVEFCPHPTALDILVCGTYKLEESEQKREPDGSLRSIKQKRRGKCILMQLAEDDSNEEDVKVLQEIPLPAILDMKWCHAQLDTGPLLSIADAEGGISLLKLDIPGGQLSRRQLIQCRPHDILCLSLDWSNRRIPNVPGSLVVSSSDGYLSLLQPSSAGNLIVSDEWHAHDHEPWIAAWDYWDMNVIYSGGDDLKLKGWDIREGFDRPMFTITRFEAGVTTVQSHPYVEHVIAVGSYDNTVRLFDNRRPQTPVEQVDVGGGAWRVKWHPHPTRKNDLLVACMHDGFKIVRFANNTLGPTEFNPSEEPSTGESKSMTIKRYDKHESLAYGVDWSYAGDKGQDSTVIASCSFYDHSMHVWKG